MKLLKPFFLLVLLLILPACSPQDLMITGEKKAPDAVSTPSSTLNADEVKQKVTQIKEKYQDPKVATWRDSAFKIMGKIYMQYDKGLDKTFVWSELSGLDKSKTYDLWLIDNAQKDTAKQKINLGKLSFDQDGNTYLYYEFSDKGDFYSYLKAQLIPEGSQEKLLEANFNPILN
jgi:hypothetical protein